MKLRKLLCAGAIVIGVAGLPAAAMAEDYVGPKKSEVLGTDLSRGTPAAVSGGTESRGLPVTGGDIAGLTVVGLAAVGTGTVLVRRSRRRTTSVA